jgi:hypothetical protein
VRPPPVGATARSGHQGWLVGRGRAAVVFGVWRTRAGVASPLTTLAQQPPPLSTSAFHGLSRGAFDPAGLFIGGVEQLGLAWGVVRVSPDRR